MSNTRSTNNASSGPPDERQRLWNHFCQVLTLDQDDLSVLGSIGATSLPRLLFAFRELQIGNPAELFAFDTNGQICPMKRGLLRSAASWLEDHDHLINDAEKFCSAFSELQLFEYSTAKKRKYTATQLERKYDPELLFHSPSEISLPEVHEEIKPPPFLAPQNWLTETGERVLAQANLMESNNPRVSPIALIRCSRGGKTRCLIELAKEVKRQDSSYSTVYITFNSEMPLGSGAERGNDMTELCTRIAFAANKTNKPKSYDPKDFLDFSSSNQFDKDWVLSWLGPKNKCILIIDELNLLLSRDAKDPRTVASFLKNNFLLSSGRGLVFSSHVLSLSGLLSEFLDSPVNREVVTIPLPLITSLHSARVTLKMSALSAQAALFLGLIPGLIVERNNNRKVGARRVKAVDYFIEELESFGSERAHLKVVQLLSTLVTGNVGSVHESLLELMNPDTQGDELVVRWIPFHMVYVLSRICHVSYFIGQPIARSLEALVRHFTQFESSKHQSGDQWEVLFLIVLIVRCLTGMFDDEVTPPLPLAGETKVMYNEPWNNHVCFCTEKDPINFVDGIPLRSWVTQGACALSIYYPQHASFELYDAIVAFWDQDGNRRLYGYQMKEGSSVPSGFAYDTIFDRSYLVRGFASQQNRSVRLWRAVNDNDIDAFFGVTAAQWSAKRWKKLNESATAAQE